VDAVETQIISNWLNCFGPVYTASIVGRGGTRSFLQPVSCRRKQGTLVSFFGAQRFAVEKKGLIPFLATTPIKKAHSILESFAVKLREGEKSLATSDTHCHVSA
jgi:hypothetical protein